MRVICAIDSFKGCMTSKEANDAAKRGILEAFPEAQVECFEVSDGGEGFLEAMRPDEIVTCHVHDALMRWTDSAFGIKDGKAIIEVAKAVGLDMVEPKDRNPLLATSYGVGELIVHAMERGCREFIIGLGGSVTSDCGLGMLRCLKRSWQIKENKAWYEPFDTSYLKSIKVTLATDVTNPLCGESGAAYVFAPQKGADAAMVKKLERRAKTFALMASKHQGFDMSNEPGAGAAGGLGYAFMEFMDANVRSGAEIVMESSGLGYAISSCRQPKPAVAKGCSVDYTGASLVITGEGSADNQTLMGKLPSVLLKHAKASNVPVMLIAGKVSDRDKLLSAGFSQVVCINDGMDKKQDPLDKSVAEERMKLACLHSISLSNT